MKSTFLDTGFFLALVLEDDSLHKQAIAWQRSLGGQLLTTEFILLEVADALVQPGVREFAEALFEMAYSDPIITLVRVGSPSSLRRAMNFSGRARISVGV